MVWITKGFVTMIEQIVLGMIQGIAEWLPVSSEGMIILVMTHFWGDARSIDTLIRQALLLHLGTLMAAVIYFREDIWALCKSLARYKSSDEETQKTLSFLIISTLISGALGVALLQVLAHASKGFAVPFNFINLLIGGCLLVTGYLELRSHREGYRGGADLNVKDGIWLGIAQGFAAIPGLSRSGLTVSTLLLRKVNKYQSLRLSFLMSIPIVLGGNIVLNWKELNFTPANFVGVAAAFVFGLLTIHGLLKVAKKINFGYFVIVFGIMTIISIFTNH